MQRPEYDELSAGLVAWAAEAQGVLGLVLVGSSAESSHAPDAWSDHDFFVITDSDSAAYGDGHMLECAELAPDELAMSRSGAARVVVDRLGDLEAPMEPTLAAAPREPRSLVTALHRSLLVGSGRAARGERLAAGRHLLDAVASLLALVEEVVPAESPVGDAHNPWRRVELTRSVIARRLYAILEHADPRAALEIAWVADEVAGAEPWWPSSLAAAISDRIAVDASTHPPGDIRPGVADA